MLEYNICKFVPFRKSTDSINIINFVFETKKNEDETQNHYYRIHYVVDGYGVLKTCEKEYSLTRGDIFFTFPSWKYSIQGSDDLKFYFISYLGIKANENMQKLGIKKSECLLKNNNEIEEHLEYLFNLTCMNNIDLCAESALLYIFSYLNKKILKEPDFSVNDLVYKIKKHIEEFYFDPELNLKKISVLFSYNGKYLSSLFAKSTGISISKYLLSIRLQNACGLMSEKITCVKDIATLCGFSDALYFSKVFKKNTNLSPSEFIASIK